MHQLHELFSHGAPHDRGLGAGCDVRTRLIVALAAIVAVVMSTRIAFGLIALGCSLTGLAAVRTPPKALACRMIGPLALATVVSLTRTFMTGTTPIAHIHLGFWQLTATREGFLEGALIASRVLGSIGIMMLLCQNNSMPELFAALRWAKVPHIGIEIAVLMYRYLYVFFEQAGCVVSAQRVRLGYSGLRRSFQSVGSLAGLVILRSLDQAEKSHEAMMARGYRGCLPLPSLPSLSRRQLTIACVGVALIAMAYSLAERWPL
ncbi:MAG TPA: cobalt ECF transporter T component CbiQ [Isosphaeraceae bacterium]|nr:cobalt ECF transporter T component CbiQ [Isosphaeraceae bacterium]